MKRLSWLLIWLPCASLAQGNIALDTTLSAIDSLAIFHLLDSLMESPAPLEETNQLAIRAGYNSNINGYTNTAGLNQFGLSAGAIFYHRSGFFADVTGYYSSEYEPGYYQTMASVGYMYSKLKKLSLMAEYRKSFYHFDTGQQAGGTPSYQYIYDLRTLATYQNNYYSTLYSNAITGTAYFEHKFINLRFDYTLLGENGYKPAHRFLPMASIYLEKKKWLNTQKILFFPSVSWLFGGSPYEYYQSTKLFRTRLEALIRIRNGLPLYELEKKTKTDWQSLNWSFSLPLYVSWKHVKASLSYTFVVPNNGGYFTCSLVRYIDFKNRRKNLQ